jgi:PucR-like helix-turn-helix protein
MGARHALLHTVFREMATDPAVVDEVVTAARTASPEVAELPEAENRRHIAVVVGAVLDAVDRPAEPDHRFVAAAEALGADRAAQGISVTALLRGVHAGRTRAVDIALARARRAGVPPEDMLDVLADFTRHAGALERHVINGHRTAELALSRTARDARTHVLRGILRGAELSEEDIERAGLRRDGAYHCLLTTVTDPVRARALEQRLASCGAIVGLVDGRLAGLAPRFPAADTTDELVVVSPAVPLAELPALYSLCATAIAAVDRHGVHALVDLAGETALAAQPILATLLADTYLAGLDRADQFHHQLVETALAYLDSGHRLDRTAAALHVHPNTVRYRLDRLSDLTGTPPDPTPTVLSTLRRWWALHTWLAGSMP